MKITFIRERKRSLLDRRQPLQILVPMMDDDEARLPMKLEKLVCLDGKNATACAIEMLQNWAEKNQGPVKP